jgi:NAD-dependent DNA ligase
MEPREALVALNLIEHVGPVRVRQLLEHFGDAPAILRASRQQLLQIRGIGEDTAEAIAAWERTADRRQVPVRGTKNARNAESSKAIPLCPMRPVRSPHQSSARSPCGAILTSLGSNWPS